VNISRDWVVAALASAVLLGASLPLAAHAETTPNPVRVGIESGEDEDLWALVVQEAKKRGLNVKVVTFNDYTQPNEALEHGELDANSFQHKPYLDNQIKTRGYHITIAGYTAIWPIGLYSHKHRSVADLPSGAKIGVPNDPSNEGRALVLLEDVGLIKLGEGAGITATQADIVSNPKNIQVRELDAGIVGRSIDDVDAAVVNTDWAAKSKLTKKDRIATEPTKDNPYRNFIAVKTGEQGDPWVRTLVASYENDDIKAALQKVYHGTAVPGW
jgi:D-methionine transport system substrate-binding protein